MSNVIQLRKTVSDSQQEQPFHFYAVCAFGWATARTSGKAIAKLRAMFDQDIARCKKAGCPIQYWLALVPLPESAKYSISCYKPDVPKVQWLEEAQL